MKYFKNLILLLLMVSIVSCVNDDATYSTTVKPIISITGQSASEIEEGEFITISLTADKAYKDDMDFKLELVSGDGTNDDFSVSASNGDANGGTSVDDGFGAFGYKVVMPAYSTTLDFRINATRDIFPEDTESFRFKLTSTDNGNGNVSSETEYIDLNVTNFVSSEVAIVLDWGTYVSYKTLNRYVLGTDADDEIEDHTENLCDLVDFDFFLDSFDSYAFTGACPEEASINVDISSFNPYTSTLADGSYDLIVDYWALDLGLSSTDNEEIIGGFNIPFTVTIARTGSFSTTFTISDLFTSFDVDSDTVGGAGERLVATLKVINGGYFVYDRFGNIMIGG